MYPRGLSRGRAAGLGFEIPKSTVHGVPCSAGGKDPLQDASVQGFIGESRSYTLQLFEHSVDCLAVVVHASAFPVTFPAALSHDDVNDARLSKRPARDPERNSQRPTLGMEFNLPRHYDPSLERVAEICTAVADRVQVAWRPFASSVITAWPGAASGSPASMTRVTGPV